EAQQRVLREEARRRGDDPQLADRDDARGAGEQLIVLAAALLRSRRLTSEPLGAKRVRTLIQLASERIQLDRLRSQRVQQAQLSGDLRQRARRVGVEPLQPLLAGVDLALQRARPPVCLL